MLRCSGRENTLMTLTSLPIAQRTLGDLVAADGRAALVLEQFGLDFCCGGRRTLDTAARARGIAVEDVVESLSALGTATADDREPAEWKDLDVLVRHILDEHHAYVRSVSPTIQAWLARLVERHGARHAELADAFATFSGLTDEMFTHMLKEEHLLFPAITELAAARRAGAARPITPFGTLANPIGVMEADHELAGDLMGRLHALTAGFAPPADACTTYRLCYAELARYEKNLHRHVHLENNVLFSRAIALEEALG
jgi:regulator of cell morphogenesis and NO signaling